MKDVNHNTLVAMNSKKFHPEKEEEILRSAVVGKYEIIRRIGVGGMATVYLARDVNLNREVAIKMLPQLFLRDDQFISRFKREARLAAMLEHPHIARIYNISDEEDICYFVMSYLPNGTLTRQLRRHGALNTEDIARWSKDICSALIHAHGHGVIHRDLKPDNIMLDRDFRAVVVDFGIAHAAEGTSITETGAVIGTPQYMSPDQACGKDLDARSDIYSMGLLMYQMATGALPFEAHDSVSLMYMHVHENPVPPIMRCPEIPRWLNTIIMKCLEKDPDARYSSALELHRALTEQKSFDLEELQTTTEKLMVTKSRYRHLLGGVVRMIAAVRRMISWFIREFKRYGFIRGDKSSRYDYGHSRIDDPAYMSIHDLNRD